MESNTLYSLYRYLYEKVGGLERHYGIIFYAREELRCEDVGGLDWNCRINLLMLSQVVVW